MRHVVGALSSDEQPTLHDVPPAMLLWQISIEYEGDSGFLLCPNRDREFIYRHGCTMAVRDRPSSANAQYGYGWLARGERATSGGLYVDLSCSVTVTASRVNYVCETEFF